jgi:hypothetical protein
MSAREHWLDRAARISVPPVGLTRRDILRRAAAGALALSIGARPQLAAGAATRCGYITRVACLGEAKKDFDALMVLCAGQGKRTAPEAIADQFDCVLGAHTAYERRRARCDATCPPPKNSGGSKKKKGRTEPPKDPPKKPVDHCDSCSYYCSPCKSTASGYICCIYPAKDGKSPCCP